MYRGFAWQQEYHSKAINDYVNTTTTTLVGSYAQLGYFLHELIAAVPSPLELATRYAYYDPDTDITDDLQHELSFAANWFFHGHLNKLTADVSHLFFESPIQGQEDGWRFRLQWDVSF